MGGSIYYQSDENDDLVEMSEHPFEKEDDFQELLADHDKLLAGEQINTDHPRRWLFVAREAGVPDQEDAGDRWSLDHLFLDQDGIPTLVEVKRSTDTRIRREVAGQMLDYAANAVVYWPIDVIIAKFEATCEDDDPDEKLMEFLAGQMEPDEFWEQVRTNLQAGKVRMLFVADAIPSELRRIIEFMNEQMDPAEVLGVEIKQYASGNQRAFASRVIGQTAEASRRKTPRGQQWTEARFFEELRAHATADEVAVAEELLRFGKDLTGRSPDWGHAKAWGTFSFRIVVNETRMSLFSVYTTKEISLNLGWNREKIGGSALSERYRQSVADSLSIDFGRDTWERKYPTLPFSALVPDNAAKLKALLNQYIADVQRLAEDQTKV